MCTFLLLVAMCCICCAQKLKTIPKYEEDDDIASVLSMLLRISRRSYLYVFLQVFEVYEVSTEEEKVMVSCVPFFHV